MDNGLKYALITLGSGTAIYLTGHFAKQYQLLNKTCFNMKGLVINKIGKESDISLKLELKNKSNIKYFITKQNFDIYINDKHVASIYQKVKRTLVKPDQSSIIWVNVKFEPLKVVETSFQAIKDLFGKNSDISIQIKGSVGIVSSGIFLNNIKFDEKMTVKQLLNPSETTEKC